MNDEFSLGMLIVIAVLLTIVAILITQAAAG